MFEKGNPMRGITIATLAMLGATMAPVPAIASGDTAPPSTPGNFRVTELSHTWLRLAWNASTDNSGSVRYEVKLDASDQWTASTIETVHGFGGLEAGTSHTASVRAFDNAGNASQPVSVNFTTLPRTSPPPAAPSNLRAVVSGGVLRSIAWNAVSGATSYALYSGQNVVTWTSGTSVNASSLVQECLVDPGSTHTLTVQAWAPGNYPGAHSAPLTVTFPSS